MGTIKITFTVSLTILLFFLSQGISYAQTQLRSESKEVSTTVGTVVTPSSGLAGVAAELANKLKAACNGAVTSSNFGKCLQGISFSVPHPDNALFQITKSVQDNECYDSSNGHCLQCVGFVQASVAGLTGSTLNNGGDAADFATSVPTGYSYIARAASASPREGDIIIKTGGGDGHIAVVTQVLDSTWIMVAEANFNFVGQVGINRSPISQWAGWLRKQ